MNVHKTRGIVLRTVKYGETSVILSIYTELFGIQSYLVNGVRTAGKSGASKAVYFQPAAILDLAVYHNELKNLQRIKEFEWAHIYRNIFSDVLHNAVALFMVELLQKTIRQPEQHSDLFYFLEDAFLALDTSEDMVMANFPLFFALHLAGFFGFRFSDNYSSVDHFLDLQEGMFVREQPIHPYFLGNPYSGFLSKVLKARQPLELRQILLNKDSRRILLQACEQYYALHIQDFGTLKTLGVLQEVVS